MKAPGFWPNEARIGTFEGGELGLLVWKFDQLVTRIDEEAYSTKGKWFLETGFGLLSGQQSSFAGAFTLRKTKFFSGFSRIPARKN